MGCAATHVRKTMREGYLLGLLIGDGTLNTDEAVLSAWPDRKIVNGARRARRHSRQSWTQLMPPRQLLPHRSDFTGLDGNSAHAANIA